MERPELRFGAEERLRDVGLDGKVHGEPPAEDISKYDQWCLEHHRLTVTVRGVEMPLWRAVEALLWVSDQDTKRPVPFRLRPGQKALYGAMCRQVVSGRPVRLDNLKARQLGTSTAIAAFFFLYGMFRPNTRWCVMADKEEHAQNIFAMYRYFYEHLDDSLPDAEEIREWEYEHPGQQHPASVKPRLEKLQYGKVMKVEGTRSQIDVIVAGESSGRSGSYSGVHSSETAFQKDLLKTNTALFATVSLNDLDSMVFIETTANGYNGYKDRWDMDASGKSWFGALFVPWYSLPSYSVEPDPGLSDRVPPWLMERWQRHPEVTYGQMAWYMARFSENMDPSLMLQEYPWDPTDAFVSSGKSVFDPEVLKRRKDEVLKEGRTWTEGRFRCTERWSADGRKCQVSNVEYVPDRAGSWRMWEAPRKGRRYVVVCDPSKGMNYDYSAIQVLEQDTGRQVARYVAKDPLDEVTEQLYCAGAYYNGALVSCENNTGPTVLDGLVKRCYPKLYVDQNPVYDDFTQSYSRRYGHTTTKANRQAMIEDFVSAFRRDPQMVRDPDTLEEMERFQVVEKSTAGERSFKAMAVGGAHDDLVMAYVPFWTVRLQQEFGDAEERQEDGAPEFRDEAGRVAYEMRRRREEAERAKVRKSRTGIVW